jgi:hypothetical protein
MIAFFMIYIIDKSFLILPLVTIAFVGTLVPFLAPPTQVERILDLSIFRIERATKVDVEYVEVPKVFVKEKHIHHYHHKIEASNDSDDGSHEDAEQLKTSRQHISEQASSVESATAIAESEEDASDLDDIDFPRKKSSRSKGWQLTIHGEEEDLKRTQPYQTIEDVFIQFLNKHNAYPTMPPPTNDSAATKSTFDNGAQHLKSGEGWVQTATPHIYVSTVTQGSWLIEAAEDMYYKFSWLPSQNIWYCAPHGFGIGFEDDESVVVHCSLDPRDINAPKVYQKTETQGPYFDEAFNEALANYEHHARLHDEEACF